MLIEPVLSDDQFLADVAAARREPGLHLWWLGQSGFLISSEGRCLLLDPYLSDSLTIKYAETDKPHERMTRRVIDPRRLDFISLVLSTHLHTDHLDGGTLKPLIEVNPDLVLVIPEAIRKSAAERLGTDPAWPVGLNDGESTTVAGVEIAAVPAAHETIERDQDGQSKFLGYVVQIGPRRIYHSGDTVRFDGMAESLRAGPPIDIALLPVNGRAPERRVAGNLTGVEAAQLAYDIRAKLAIPCHYEMFRFNTASPDPFAEACVRLNQPHRVLRAGERLTLS